MSDLAIVCAVFAVLTIVGTPLIAAIGIATVLALHLIDIPFTLLAQSSFTALQPFPLLTIPLFVLAGRLMEVGGMSERLIEVAKSFVGNYRGSLGMVTVLACMLFAALSGSGPATTAAIGSVMIPAMRREGYSPRFAAAVSASAGALGSMIPPSNLLIIYGLVSETSIPRLFLAGFAPGFFVTGLLLLVSYVVARRNNFGGSVEGTRFAIGLCARAFWAGKWALGAPIIILGGIYSGAFTPTEAASVAVFYALFVGFFVYRKLSVTKVVEALRFTALMAGLLILLAPAQAFGQLTAYYDVPTAVQDLLTSVTSNRILTMLLIGAFYILIGTFMESLAQIILFTAVFLPLVKSMGVDPVLFGVFTVMTCEIGFLTPPVGANLNVAARLAGIRIEDVSIGVLPFILAYVVGLLFMIVWPEATLFLPNWVYGATR
ncbi:MAG: TRAP transporter large permease [Gammaproteobacteria bacterium]|nr:TRAP transporter large permease [Gammaproteobacteria bacterium]MBU1441147.1 TRAP transporter large permease [Gammaproteobacteria bacterium]MBU2287750.1 TRAP transporter large permease [Gammaproteobacteria bacterium]